MSYSVYRVNPSFGRASTTRQRILEAIYKLKNPKPYQIKKYLEKGEVRIKYNIRTIHRWLKKLSSEGAIINIGGKYSISERDLRYVGSLLGNLALNHIFDDRYPLRNLPIKKSLPKLVIGLGVLLFYMFIEASRPVQDVHDEVIRPQQMDDLIKSWLIQASPIMGMFEQFMFAYREPTDLDFKLKRVAGKWESLVTHNELDEVTIAELSRILQEMYPKEYSQIKTAKEEITSEISGNLRELRRDLPFSILYPPAQTIIFDKYNGDTSD